MSKVVNNSLNFERDLKSRARRESEIGKVRKEGFKGSVMTDEWPKWTGEKEKLDCFYFTFSVFFASAINHFRQRTLFFFWVYARQCPGQLSFTSTNPPSQLVSIYYWPHNVFAAAGARPGELPVDPRAERMAVVPLGQVWWLGKETLYFVYIAGQILLARAHTHTHTLFTLRETRQVTARF